MSRAAELLVLMVLLLSSLAPGQAAYTVTSAANDKVRAALETLVRDTDEIGLQVAAYLDGKLVIDAWAGMADPATGRPVDGDTLFMLSSTTKGVTATDRKSTRLNSSH